MAHSEGGEFRSLLLEGLFEEQGGQLVVTLKGSGEVVSVGESLALFKGRKVRFVLHFAPVVTDVAKRGMGCCHWEGECPAGHHLTPEKMLVFQATGICTDVPEWQVGGIVLPFVELPGHDARLIMVADFAPPELKGDISDLKRVVEQIAEMKSFLAGLAGVTERKK